MHKLTYFLNIIRWKTAGNINANNVQQLAPTKAIRWAKLGTSITMIPVMDTMTIRVKF